MTVSTNFQFQFNNLQFGAGTPYAVLDVDGLESLPGLRVQDDNRGFNDGAFSGRDFYEGRTIVMTIHTFAGNGNTAQTNFNLLQSALLPQAQGTQALQFLLSVGETPKTINARVRQNKTLIDVNYALGRIISQWSFYCPEPRYYDATSTLVSLSPQALAGRTYNKTFSYSFGAGSNQVQTYTTNAGRANAGGVITVTGPVTNPVIGSTTQNKYLTVNTTLASTDVLTLDLTNKTVVLTSFVASQATTAASGNGSVATLTFATTSNFNAGDTVNVSGVTPTGYNGTYLVTQASGNTISYLNSTTNSQTVAGTVSAVNGTTTNIRNLLSNGSSWFDVQPGLNGLYFTGSAYTVGTTQASITYANAYV